MTRTRHYLAATVLTAFAFTAFGFAGSGNDYDMNWFTIDGGGEFSFAGDFELHGTIGQHDAGPAMSGGDFSLAGGFWTGAPGDPGFEIATLFDFEIITGSLLAGGLPEMADSDDAWLHTRSWFGNTLIDLHHMEMRILANTTINAPTTIDLTLEAHINDAAGIVQVRAFSYTTNQYDFIGQYAVGLTDNVQQYPGLDATKYVSTLGEIDVKLKHIVFKPIFAFLFESFLDQVEIVVNE